ncbi:MAG: nitroreductase family deazaflavin-dependent oxidoreductase [Acidimicrobiales bacterium]
MTTTGRKSGKESTWPVLYLDDEDRIVVVASNGGRDQHPAWHLNLRATPECVVQIGSERRAARARDATPDEREVLWPRLHELYSGFAEYMRKTDRELPIVLLEPHDRVS